MVKQAQSSPESQPGNRRRIIRGLAPWAVSFGIIFYVIFTEDMGLVAGAFNRASLPVYLLVLIPFLLALLLLESAYLYLGFRWFAGAGRFGELLRARAATYLLTVVSIFVGLGGLVVYGRRRYGISYTLGTSIMLNELLHELASMCTLALTVGLLLPVAMVPDSALGQVRGVMLAGMIGVGFRDRGRSDRLPGPLRSLGARGFAGVGARVLHRLYLLHDRGPGAARGAFCAGSVSGYAGRK